MGRKRATSDLLQAPEDKQSAVERTSPEGVSTLSLEARLSAVLDGIVQQFLELSASVEGTPPSISDLIRTVQLRRELTSDEPVGEMEVRWVESSEKAS